MPARLVTSLDTVVASNALSYGLMAGVYRTATGTTLSPTVAFSTAVVSSIVPGTRTYYEPILALDVKTSREFGADLSSYRDKSAITTQVANPYIPSSIL